MTYQMVADTNLPAATLSAEMFDLAAPGIAPTLGTTPLLVRGLGLPRPSLEDLRRAIGDMRLWAIIPPKYDYVEMDPEEYFQGFIAGTERRNIVDHYLEDARFASMFPVPSFISGDDLLREDPKTQYYHRCLVMTPVGAYTARHVDAFGLGGWLYLAEGEKEWEFYSGRDQALLFDPVAKEYFDPEVRPAPGEVQAHIDELRRWRIIQRAGELVAIPPGAPHRVRTHKPSWGWGGSFLPRALLPAAVDYHRFELSHWPPHEINFRRFVADRCAAAPDAPWAVEARALLDTIKDI